MALTIKELTDAVGTGITPRMVRHYHQLGLMPPPPRSPGNYRLYSDRDVRRLQRIVALKQQGFQLSHIQKMLETEPEAEQNSLLEQLQRQYQTVIQQIAQLRQTASALEGLLGRDRHCQTTQAEVLSQLKRLEAETQLEKFWSGLDAHVDAHPEAFGESLQRLLPDWGDRSEVEIDLLSKLVLACGDISLVQFVQIGNQALTRSREALKSGCAIAVDVAAVNAAIDHTRLAHLGCHTQVLIDNPHITSAAEAEQAFWQDHTWKDKLRQLPIDTVLVVGYAPSVLLAVNEAIGQGNLQPALVIGMPIGFSHAPAAKRKLMHSDTPFITVTGTMGGGLLAATAFNSLVESLIEKPDCHCYLGK
ncbi:precorrin-8X methylmutase [Microcoleus sp. FACHB-1515]|uniref:precorrin-8X methylmutase n=1 Tax=Cyanophyceae TaxID=3028117 RepID=UPI001681F90F|nr:precorrin-8X methylmutase [Microcoleus sp. FACHB-1515]MBD2090191.1 precorrin-8X methylmutase [Microcoleus sp. FACHB-1515]